MANLNPKPKPKKRPRRDLQKGPKRDLKRPTLLVKRARRSVPCPVTRTRRGSCWGWWRRRLVFNDTKGAGGIGRDGHGQNERKM